MDKRRSILRLVATLSFSALFCLAITAQVKQDDIRPKILHIVSKLKKESVLHLGLPVGISGKLETNNRYYKLYKKLGAKATDQELLLLTDDSSKIIAIYSFLALYNRSYPGMKEIFLKHLTDSTEIWVAGGCTGYIARVNSLMLRHLNPAFLDSRTPYLTQEEHDRYAKQIAIQQ